METQKLIRILEVCDRPGWAIDRLSKPLSEIYENVDQSYFNAGPKRYLDSGYSDWKTSIQYNPAMTTNYDVVHFHRLEAAVIGLDNVKAKKVLTLHTERLKDWEDPRILKFDVVIASTEFSKKHFLEHFNNPEHPKIFHVPHGIDLKKYLVGEINPQSKEVGYVGRIVEWKRWTQIQKAVNMAKLKLNGCGYIEKGGLYNKWGLIDDVDFKFHNFVPESQMTNFYHRMSMFASLSTPHIESGPLPTMEAMACGIPVISTNIGWATDWATHMKDIYFVKQEEAEDVNVLSKIIRKVYDDKELLSTLRTNALRLVKDFSIEEYAEKLMFIYRHLYYDTL